MSLRFCLALLALFSLSAASDPDCDELIKPQENRTQVAGKWILHVGAVGEEKLLKDLDTIKTSWIKMTAIPGSDDLELFWADRDIHGKCYSGSSNTTYTGNITKVTFHFNGTDYNNTGEHLKTCDDCVLWSDNTMSEGQTVATKALYLFTRTGDLNEADLEVFKKQAACLNLTAGFHFGDNKDLCPEEEVVTTKLKEEEH